MVFFTSRGIVDSDTAIGDLDVETKILLNEDGTPVNYLIVNQGKPGNSSLYDDSCDGTWILRKDIYNTTQWNPTVPNSLPSSSLIDACESLFSHLDIHVQQSIKTVKIPYCIGNGSSTVNSGSNGLEIKIFPLSPYEFGFSATDNSNLPIDGAKLSYFLSGAGITANQKRAANSVNWTRTPVPTGTNSAYRILSSGELSTNGIGSSYGTRPCIILPFDFKIRNNQIVS